MDAVYAQVVESIYSRAIIHDKPRFLVAIAGAPGSGKTTLANALTERLNAMPASIRRHTVCVPMDGFHLSRAELDQLPNRKEAYVRRGAPWTFDVSGFIMFVQRLRKWAEKDTSPFHNQTTPPPSPSSSEILHAPSFDHEKKDPVTDGISITPDTSIIILEGNYLLLDELQWRDVASMVDYRVFVEADLQVARERVAKRHVLAGIEPTLDDGFRRVDQNDFLNAQTISERRLPADLVINGTPEHQSMIDFAKIYLVHAAGEIHHMIFIVGKSTATLEIPRWPDWKVHRLNKEINDLEVSYEDLGRDNILWNEELGSNADNEMPLLLSLGTGNIWPGQTSTATKRVAVTPGNGCRRRQNHNSVGITKCIALMVSKGIERKQMNFFRNSRCMIRLALLRSNSE